MTEPLDVVYLVREGEPNTELRYSLRSLAANLEHGRVWIAGHKPEWVAGVEWLQTRQSLSKYENSTANLVTACTCSEISPRFVLMNDDFYILRELAEIPTRHRGPVRDVVEHYARRRRTVDNSDYLRGMVDTARLLARWGYDDPLSYELHVPIVLEKELVLDVLRRAWLDAPEILALHKRTLYGNVAELGGDEMGDVKIPDVHVSAWLPSWEFLSSSDYSFGRLLRRLNRIFPGPSRYERSIAELEPVLELETG